MTDEQIQKVVVATLEAYIRLQAEALKLLVSAEPHRQQPPQLSTPPPRRRGARRRLSMVDMTVAILAERQVPVHIDELVDELRLRYGRVTDRDALSSALGKKAKEGVLVRRVAAATFAAIALPTVGES